jgi:hypothetical protein
MVWLAPGSEDTECGSQGAVGVAVHLAHPFGGLYVTAMRVRRAKIPLPLGLHSPLSSHSVPQGSQGVGMGPRNQARRLPTDGPTRRESGQAIHPPRLRLVRQVSLDCRVASVPEGAVHHCGWGSGLGRNGRQIGLRQATFRRPRRRSVPGMPSSYSNGIARITAAIRLKCAKQN